MRACTQIGIYTIKELKWMGEVKGTTKADIFNDDVMKKLGLMGSFDFALPQSWLNDFAHWCRSWDKWNDIDYDLIRSTTVWTDEEMITCCVEVMQAYRDYRKFTSNL